MRIKELQKELDYDAVIIENPVDLYYLTGLRLSKGILGVTKEDAILFVDSRYFAVAEMKAPCQVRLLIGDAVAEWIEARGIQTAAFDTSYTTVDRLEALKKFSVEWKPISGLLTPFRVVKDRSEIAALKRAGELTMRGIKHVESCLKTGVREEELALEFEFFVRKHGASRLSFEPIIAFGENSAFPHYRSGKTKLEQGHVVLIDVGAVVDQYAGDMTRVTFFGRADKELHKMLDVTVEAQKKALEQVRPGASVGSLDRAARDVFAKEGMEDLFLHGLGHGIGLETHEFPSIREKGVDQELKLKEGMVFTIEPGLYRPGLGGVRYEDMVIVTANGYELC